MIHTLTTYNVLEILALAWVLTNVPEIISLIKTQFNIWKLTKALLSCFKCVTFWITLAFTLDIFMASMISFVAYQIDLHILNKPFEL